MPISPIVSSVTTPLFTGEGSFSAGTRSGFFFSFTDILGRAYDPSDFEVDILNPSDTSVETGTALDKIRVGEFAYTWAIPAAAATGTYTFNLTYTVETVDGPITSVYSQEFIVSEIGQGSITLREVATRDFLESLIRESMAIPVFDEPLSWRDTTRTHGELTFPRWNQIAGAKIFRNQQLMDTGYTIDYLRGRVDFDVPVSEHTQITATYNFRWFEDEELDSFIEQGVNEYNIWPPQTSYTVNNIPDTWLIAGIYGAAVNAIRRLLFGTIYQQPVKVYGTMERAEKVFSQLESLKKNYLEERDKLLEQKKFGPYAGLTKSVTVPEFTLPGGRSRWFRYLFKGAVIFFPIITWLSWSTGSFVV